MGKRFSKDDSNIEETSDDDLEGPLSGNADVNEDHRPGSRPRQICMSDVDIKVKGGIKKETERLRKCEKQLHAMMRKAEELAENCKHRWVWKVSEDSGCNDCPKRFSKSIRKVEDYILDLQSKRCDFVQEESEEVSHTGNAIDTTQTQTHQNTQDVNMKKRKKKKKNLLENLKKSKSKMAGQGNQNLLTDSSLPDVEVKFIKVSDEKVDNLRIGIEKGKSNRKITSGNNNQVKDLTLTYVEDENLKESIETVDNLRIKEGKEESWSELQIKVMIQKTKSLEEAFEQKLPRLSRMDKEYKCPQEFLQSISRIEECMKHLIKENNDYIIRLSQLAGDRLTENNPSITDLNDPKRPWKLVEQYNQLYDDEWTDAMEILVKKIPKSIDKDEKCVNYLFSLLKTVYAYCKERSKQQLHGLTEQLFLMKNPSVEQVNDMLAHNPTERKKFTERRKQTASVAVMMLQQTLKEDGGIFIKETGECIPGMDTRIVEELLRSPYFEKCIELCWQFVIQDPPMYLETCSLKGTNINKNTHKEYTHSGYVVKYVVWPALYLHEGTNSDVLSKGVVQPEEIYFY